MDPDAVWHRRSDGSRDEAGMGLGIGPREGVLLGPNLGRTIVTNGDCKVYVCDSAATWPSSQITLGKLVTKMDIALLSEIQNFKAYICCAHLHQI